MKIMKLVIGNPNNPYMTEICTLKPVLNQQALELFFLQRPSSQLPRCAIHENENTCHLNFALPLCDDRRILGNDMCLLIRFEIRAVDQVVCLS